MDLIVDLHAHSPYAGGSGKTDFSRLRTVMLKKGISVYGSGDILLKKWEDELSSAFSFSREKQMWVIENNLFLMPQTEIIITLPYPGNEKKRKLFHLVILFSYREDISAARKIMSDRGSRLSIGRPFVTFDSTVQLHDFADEISSKTGCSLIPAHVMTPDGILGGKNPVNSLQEIFGDTVSRLTAIESGLSADPEMLAAVSAETSLPVVSFSDAHSASFNKLGREFTTLKCSEISSESVNNSIRNGEISLTAEFPPFEGRYYLTGHHSERPGHNGTEFIVQPGEIRSQGTCPVCGKNLVPGVLERITAISRDRKTKSQKFIYQIPLIEIIAQLRNTGVRTKTAEKEYLDILKHVANENEIWTNDIADELEGKISPDVLNAVNRIKRNDFSIRYGYDGQYGSIIL